MHQAGLIPVGFHEGLLIYGGFHSDVWNWIAPALPLWISFHLETWGVDPTIVMGFGFPFPSDSAFDQFPHRQLPSDDADNRGANDSYLHIEAMALCAILLLLLG